MKYNTIQENTAHSIDGRYLCTRLFRWLHADGIERRQVKNIDGQRFKVMKYSGTDMAAVTLTFLTDQQEAWPMCWYLMPCRQATTKTTTVYQPRDNISGISTHNIPRYLTMPPTISYKSPESATLPHAVKLTQSKTKATSKCYFTVILCIEPTQLSLNTALDHH